MTSSYHLDLGHVRHYVYCTAVKKAGGLCGAKTWVICKTCVVGICGRHEATHKCKEFMVTQ